MLNILVTGSAGFIGKNFLNNSIDESFNILEFNRNDSNDCLEKITQRSDFVVHLAGEVRPQSSKDQFKKSNNILTGNIIHSLKKSGKKKGQNVVKMSSPRGSVLWACVSRCVCQKYKI